MFGWADERDTCFPSRQRLSQHVISDDQSFSRLAAETHSRQQQRMSEHF